MGAEEGLSTGVKLIIIVLLCGVMLLIWKAGSSLINNGLGQANNLTKEFSDVDKQKYEKLTLTGDSVISAITTYWEDPTCEIVVCTLDGINAVYNMKSTDGSYSVPFTDDIGGMPAADAKGRVFPTDATISSLADFTKATPKDSTKFPGDVYDASVVGAHVVSGNPSPNAVIVDAAKIIQNPGTDAEKVLATDKGYNALVSVGSGGYISNTSTFVGSVQKDANGVIRRITFVQKS